ncbi:hypothetical protein K2173_023065 [Erythroxylum novogranatense]|uniref:LisH domain-containing protein n=1 Tax=Erythroxylum novogranatense TaxID=1862640 RepID=A0AAV8T824_9ROSI|nr:hypothetical protein K2173_023065 [Erythroxylum novogranatense]
MERSTLLESYRHDRRKLIEFLLASGLIKELRTPSGPADSLANIDFDRLSADYILECVKSDGVLDLNEATKRYLAESAYPATISSQAGNSYFLVSNPDLTGSPPRRMPPPVYVKSNANHFPRSRPGDPFPVEKASMNGDGNSPRYNKASAYIPTIPLGNSEIPEIALPSLSTGLSDDDLRESAYELLIITVFLSGDEMCMFEEKKKEKSSNRLLRLKGKKDKLHSQSLGRHSDLMNVVRAQMQASGLLIDGENLKGEGECVLFKSNFANLLRMKSMLTLLRRSKGRLQLPRLLERFRLELTRRLLGRFRLHLTRPLEWFRHRVHHSKLLHHLQIKYQSSNLQRSRFSYKV